MKSILVVVAIALFAISAQAIELNFQFKVFSSGPDIYACNVGLKHADPAGQVCYYDNTNLACQPGDCLNNDCAKHNCICTSNNGGAYLMDFFHVGYGSWLSNITSQTSKKAGQSSYVQLFTDAQAWDNRIDNLTFNFGSERYGAQYYVDICFRGPQIEYYDLGVTSNWAITTQVNATDFNLNTLRYRQLADLSAKVEYVCDLQGMGNYQHAVNNSGQYDTSDNEAIFGAGDTRDAKGPLAFNGNAITFHNQNTLINGLYSPRFCKVRYYFDENAVQNVRKWQIHGAQVCTFTRIEEPAGE